MQFTRRLLCPAAFQRFGNRDGFERRIVRNHLIEPPKERPAAFVRAVVARAASPIPFDEIVEVSRVAIQIAAR